MRTLLKKIRKIHTLLTDQFWRAKANYIKYYDLLPINEYAILMEAEHGKKLDGNIFYLLRYLATSKKYANYKIYLSSMGRHMRKFNTFLREHSIENVTVVMLASDEYMRLLASAKYLINDTSFGPYFMKKPGQIYLNTWHGTPLKTLGKSDRSGFHAIGNIQKNFLCSDYLLYPNEYTKNHMVADYMLENIGKGFSVLAGYPRNEIFFDSCSRQQIREKLGVEEKRVYVYMPTYRGSVGNGKTSRSTTYLAYFLYELDRQLAEDEILYVNLHPLARESVDFKEFKHIQKFPGRYEVYEFLNIADVLVTDYSSVFFDFAITGQKVVLFPYDEEEYLASRGMYMDIADLPFPRVYSVPDLLCELRSDKKYDDCAFLSEFCPYENKDASQLLCDRLILGEDTSIQIEPIADNGKKNVLIYTGNLARNGITTSLQSLMSCVDHEKYNYYLTFISEKIKNNKAALKTFANEVNYIATTGDMNLTILDRVVRKMFKSKLISASAYMKLCGNRVAQGFERSYGGAKIDAAIQFNGYEQEVILQFSTFSGVKSIYVHNDMVQEIATKGNQRRDVLRYAYNNYDHVAVVTQDIFLPTYKISGKKENITVARNVIDYRSVLEKGMAELGPDSYGKCSAEAEILFQAVNSDSKKFVNIGRFSPEKGHERLIRAFARVQRQEPNSHLFIIGGYDGQDSFATLEKLVRDLNLADRVFLLLKMDNPHCILKRCDYFVLSSFYEGFGLVLAEADILGKPVVSTDIPGPRGFMSQNGGTLVENSEEGIYEGMRRLAAGKIAPMNVDYKSYNQQVVLEFEALLS